MSAGSAKPHRLPSSVRPCAYHLHIRASPDEAAFHGKVRIEVELAQPAQAIEVHARGMTFTRVAAEQGSIVEGQAAVHKDTESATLRFPAPLKAGKATLLLDYEAPVSPSLVGLYLSKDGPEQCLVTQFEATDARQCFPCFDEPAFKATLQWSVTAPPGVTVLANSPLQGKRREPDGWQTWDFAPTPPLSSYLAAIAIGNFASTPEARAGTTPHRVWAMKDKEHLGVEARDAAARMQPWFEEYFGVPYRFAKYDQLAVPSFSFGAMENAGLVVFRASRLLMDKHTASWKDLRDITLVVSHEFAHQWFGNHVTMQWWDDLWLNESFAEWIAHACVDALWPQHEVWLDFQRRTNGALSTDALGATHPIYQPVQTPAEAAELFDAITYGKGSAVLRMLEAYLGAEPFRAGLRAYMKEFGGSNARGADLWRHLSAASHQPVERIMHAWIEQPGHPVVRLRLDGTKLHLHQERFRTRPGAAPGNQAWPVPLVLRYEDDAGVHSTRHLLEGAQGEATIPARGRLRWLHANAGDLGFYRTDPDDALLQGLAAHVAKLSPSERVGLLRDQWALMRSAQRPPQGVMKLLDAMVPPETHYAVVEMASDLAREGERYLEMHGDEAALRGWRRWTGHLFAGQLQRVGPDAKPGEAPSVGIVRASAYRALAGVAQDRHALDEAQRLAARERGDPAAVDPNLAGTVVGLAAQGGDGARFDEHVKVYLQRRDSKRPPQEADRYLGSFVAFRRPELVQRALGLLTDGTVPKQSIGPLLCGMLREPHAQRAAWQHAQDHWATLRKELGDSWAANIAESTGALHPALKVEVGRFLDAQAKDLVQSSSRARDLLEERALLFERVVPPLAAWARSA